MADGIEQRRQNVVQTSGLLYPTSLRLWFFMDFNAFHNTEGVQYQSPWPRSAATGYMYHQIADPNGVQQKARQ